MSDPTNPRGGHHSEINAGGSISVGRDLHQNSHNQGDEPSEQDGLSSSVARLIEKIDAAGLRTDPDVDETAEDLAAELEKPEPRKPYVKELLRKLDGPARDATTVAVAIQAVRLALGIT